MLADKGHDSDDVRASLLLKRTVPVIPPTANRKEAIACDFRAYKDRNRVERLFNKLKQSRRIATRYDKAGVSFLGFLALATAKLWIPDLCQQDLGSRPINLPAGQRRDSSSLDWGESDAPPRSDRRGMGDHRPAVAEQAAWGRAGG